MARPVVAPATAPPRPGTPRRIALTLLATFLATTAALPITATAASEHPEGRADNRSLDAVTAGIRAGWAAGLADLVAAIVAGSESVAEGAASARVELRGSRPRAAGRARPARLRPFSMNLYRRGDFVNQKTAYWCIPASTQTMMNMMDRGRPNRSRKLQARLYRVGDHLEEDGSFSRDPEPDRFRGMGISEWAGLLNRYDYGPYGLAGFKSRQNALRKAARMMRKTGKPVGLVVWRGAHAWVMSGFSATADPALTRDFTVTSVWVHDPWFPRVSPFWGRSRSANARLSPRALGQDFVPYGRPGRRNPERDGRYMLVLPGTKPSPPDDD
jgi:hypothetical protein